MKPHACRLLSGFTLPLWRTDQVIMNMILVNVSGEDNSYLPSRTSCASSMPIRWASSGVTSPGSNAWMRCRPRFVPLSMAWRRVQAIQCRRSPLCSRRRIPATSIRLVGIADIVNRRFSVDLIGCVFVTAISAPISPVSPPYRLDRLGRRRSPSWRFD